MFAKEFARFTKDHYADKIAKGHLTVNGKKVETSYKLKDSDHIEHTTLIYDFSTLTVLVLHIIHKKQDKFIKDNAMSRSLLSLFLCDTKTS